MPIPWIEAIPAPIPGDVLTDFVTEFRRISATLPHGQDQAVADPGALSADEWRLERDLLRLIADCFGSARVLAEEYFNRTGRTIAGSGPLSFIVDPLDGSASYARGSDRYTSSLTILQDGEPIIGLVFRPAESVLYSALRGHGAWRDDTEIRHSRDPRRVVAVKMQHLVRPAFKAPVDRLTGLGYTVERMESTSLKLCWLAEGRRAGVVKWLNERSGVVMEWGTTAGALLCREVGIQPMLPDGRPWRGEAGGLIIGDDHCLADLGMTVSAYDHRSTP